MSKLTLDDIADVRAYERERDEFRRHVVALKKRRRIGVGPFVTLVFENRDTIRFQVQEMARVEKILSDEGIQAELDTYNPLVPEPGHLAATLFVELTDEYAMREWLPRLVGIETAVELRLGAGPDAEAVRCTVDPDFALTAEQIDRLEAGPARLALAHPAYDHEVELSDDNRAELVADLRGT
jgi:hypothetical protein